METMLSVATLAAVIWTVHFLLPRAARQEDRFALVCTVLTVLLALVAWLVIGHVRLR